MPKKKKIDLKAAAREKTQVLFDRICEVALNKTNSIAGMQAVSLLEKWMDYDSEVNTKKEPLRVQFIEIKALEDKSIASLDPIEDPLLPVSKKKSRIDVIIYGTAQQASFIFSKARYKGCFAGRRWGKTYLFRNDAIKKCMEKPYSHYMYITPSYSQCCDEFKAICDNPAVAPLIFKADGSKPPNIVFKNGSKISFRSYDRPNLIRGKAADFIWIDEIQDKCFTEESFYSIIKPCVADRRGTITVSGQFKGKDNWYYKEFFEKGQGGTSTYNDQYFSMVFPTSSGLMFTTVEGQQELANIKEATPKHIYEQEFDCIPNQAQNSVFPKEDIDAAITGTFTSNGQIFEKVNLNGPRGRYSYILGVDIGKTRDNTAINILERETGLTVFTQTLPLGQKYELQAQHVKNLAQRWNNAVVVIDSTGKAAGGYGSSNDAHVKFFRQFVPNLKEVNFTPSNKPVIVNTAVLEFQQNTLHIPKENKVLIDQLRTYEYKYSNGYFSYNAPDNQHDDSVSALLLCIWGRHNKWGAINSGSGNGFIGV